MSILLSQITLPPLLLRESYKDVDDLAASIKENGLLYPILLRPISKGKDIPHGITYYEVVAGCRRYTAFKNMGISKLDEGEYIIKKIDDKTAFEIALIENCQRNNMTAQEEAKAFYAYCSQRKYGSVSELASKINRSQPYISARIRLLDLPESIFKDIGVLTNFSVSHAEALTHADLPPERIEEIKNLIDYTGMTVEQTAEIVADQKTHKDSSVGESYLRSETDRANEPYRNNAVAFQSEEDKEEHFEHLPSPKTEKLVSTPMSLNMLSGKSSKRILADMYG